MKKEKPPQSHQWQFNSYIKMKDGEMIYVYTHIYNVDKFYAYNNGKKYFGNSHKRIQSRILEDSLYENLINEYII